MILETERLILRPPDMGDADTVQTLVSDFKIAATTLMIPHPYPPGGAAEFIERIQTTWAKGSEASDWVFAIILRKSQTFMGVIGLHANPTQGRAEIGYWLGVPYWNNGYVTEAARAVIDFGFDKIGLRRIDAGHFGGNGASGRVMQKAGMTYEGTMRAYYWRFDQPKDAVWYAILREEWEAKTSKRSDED